MADFTRHDNFGSASDALHNKPKSDSKRQAAVKRPSRRVQLEFTLPTRTRGSETASTDLKTIVRRYQQVGALPPSHLQFGDATELPASRLEAMEIIAQARAAFESLPLKVRQAIDHDPRRLEDWMNSNPDLAREYGLFTEASPQPSPPPSPPHPGSDEGKKERKAPPSAPEAGEGA